MDFTQPTVDIELEPDEYWDKPLESAYKLHSLLVAHHHIDSANHLNPLIASLKFRDEDSLSPWVDTDLLDRVVENPLRDPNYEVSDATVWDIVTRVLVFLPIVWTWLSLTQASRAYGEYIAEFPNQTGNSFIALWQTGFEGKLPWHWQFSAFAGVATLLGLGIIIFILLTSIRSRVSRKTLARLTYEFQNLFIPGVTELKIHLYPHKLETLPRYKSDISSAAKTLSKLNTTAQTLMSDVARVTQQSADTFHGRIEDLRELSTELLSKSRESLSQQQGIINEFGVKLNNLTNSVQDLKAMMHDAANAYRKEPPYLKDLMQSLETLETNSHTTKDATIQQIATIEGNLDALTKSLVVLIDNMNTLSITVAKNLDKAQIQSRIRSKSPKKSRRIFDWLRSKRRHSNSEDSEKS